MATFNAYASIDMTAVQSWYGDITQATASRITITGGSLTQYYYGQFGYGADGWPTGTLTGSEQWANGTRLWSLAGITLNATTAARLIDNGNAQGVLNYALSGNDTLNGSSLDDILRGGAGNDILNGNSGIDTASYTLSASRYTISHTATGFTVKDNTGTEGTDILNSIERLQFADKSVALDIDGHAGQAYRLYQAAFDRAPDHSGLGYWITNLDRGSTLQQVADGFIRSTEFKSLYGQNTSNAEFVALLYQNVLHRPLDDAGNAYWVAHLDQGIETRAQVLVGFSESQENQTQIIGNIQNGIEFTPFG